MIVLTFLRPERSRNFLSHFRLLENRSWPRQDGTSLSWRAVLL